MKPLSIFAKPGGFMVHISNEVDITKRQQGVCLEKAFPINFVNQTEYYVKISPISLDMNPLNIVK
jgi:hypothetical protein